MRVVDCDNTKVVPNDRVCPMFELKKRRESHPQRECIVHGTIHPHLLGNSNWLIHRSTTGILQGFSRWELLQCRPNVDVYWGKNCTEDFDKFHAVFTLHVHHSHRLAISTIFLCAVPGILGRHVGNTTVVRCGVIMGTGARYLRIDI